MPSHPRLFVPGAIYHVYRRIARGEFVFDDDHEAIEFIEALRRVRDLDGWTVFAWCLSGHSLAELSSRSRSADQARGRIEFAILAVGRYGLRVCDVASLLCKHPNSITKWLNKGLGLEGVKVPDTLFRYSATIA